MAIPVRTAAKEVFERVRTLFQNSEFNEQTAEQRAVDKDFPFPPFPESKVPEDSDAAGVLMGMFLRAGVVSGELLEARLGAQAAGDLRELGLIEPVNGNSYKPTVRIRPMYGLYVLSDLWDATAGPNPPNLADDVVFPPDIPNTLTYLSYVPLDPCERFLEGCGGSGVVALMMANQGAKHAWSFDITERSTAFAGFSARLNGLDNFTAGRGDTYEPAGDRQFDRIAVHPPYVPVLKHTWIYHAGGNDGEQITRKHVQDLHKVLAPGGRFYCRCLGSDRQDSPFEKRIREWLGEHSDEFDVAIHVIRVLEPITYVMAALMRGRAKAEEIPEWGRLFESLKIFHFLASVVVIQRRAEERPVFTVRRKAGPFSGPRELEWLMHWETERAKGCEDIILQSKLRPGKTTLQLTHGIHEGKWALAEQKLEVAHPYPNTWEVDPLGAYLIPKLTGAASGAEVFDGLIKEGVIGGNLDPRRFARTLGELVSGGFVVVDKHEPPVQKEREQEEI
ncbi:MAG: methyltransferase [Bryobacterales bacterium]|nr:methyltransferase [Bryobacterales bacterium]